jgi:hypothetical protein
MRKRILPILIILGFLVVSSSVQAADPISGFLNAVGHAVNNIAGNVQHPNAAYGQEQRTAGANNNLSETDKEAVYDRVMGGTYDNSRVTPSGPHEGLSADRKKVILYVDTGFNAAPGFNHRQPVIASVRYVDKGDGTLRDTLVKGLMWAKDPKCLLHNYRPATTWIS